MICLASIVGQFAVSSELPVSVAERQDIAGLIVWTSLNMVWTGLGSLGFALLVSSTFPGDLLRPANLVLLGLLLAALGSALFVLGLWGTSAGRLSMNEGKVLANLGAFQPATGLFLLLTALLLSRSNRNDSG